jgi:hypothetical protein
VRPLLLDVRGRDDLGGKVEPLAQVVEALGGHGVVVVPPAVLRLDEAARGQGLHGLDDEQVLGLDGRVLDLVVLGGDENAIAEEGLCRSPVSMQSSPIGRVFHHAKKLLIEP